MATNFINGNSFFVTGAAGSVGKEVVRQLFESGASRVVALDNNEGDLTALSEVYRKNPKFRVALGDVRDEDCLSRASQNIDYIVHAAALKQVPICETAPMEAVQTNILGVQNVVRAALKNNVKKIVFTSSDKAVNPTNVMGVSKLMGERLMTAAHANRANDVGPRFCSTRFGNVAGSRGSVIPLFCEQIAAGGPVTLTDERMSRFVMTMSRAVNLVLGSLGLCQGGEVFITKMPALKITDLAHVMIDLLAPAFGHAKGKIQIEMIGSRPGEKLYEELMTTEEVNRTWELDDLFVMLPSFWDLYDSSSFTYVNTQNKKVEDRYHSGHVEFMSVGEIRQFLLEPGVLSAAALERLKLNK